MADVSIGMMIINYKLGMGKVKQIFLFSTFMGFLFFAQSYAESKDPDTSTTLPTELLFAEKPIDPKCVSAAMEIRNGVELSSNCAQFSGDGFSSATAERFTQRPNGEFGYDLDFEDGRSGGFFYRYVGKKDEGLILYIYYSSGGSGHFSDLGIYRREGNILREVRNIAGGDRCAGGIRDAKMEDGHLVYSYNATSLDLYQKYMPSAKYRGDLGSGFTNCGAVISMKDDQTQSVELTENAIIPSCFKDEYTKQVGSQKVLSNNEAKSFIQKFSEACPLTEEE